MGCEAPREGFCPAAVHPSDPARAWLRSIDPPASVKDYFDRIGDQQEAIETICK